MTSHLSESAPRVVKVTSADGTSVSYEQSGSGPALLLVHGALMDAQGWLQVTQLLQPSFSVCALDRRGRHASGNNLPYDPQREVEDLFAVVESLPGQVSIAAHSSGATLVLDAIEQGLPIGRMVLYEPPLSEEHLRPHWQALANQLDMLVTNGEVEAAARLFLIEGPRNPPEAVDRMQAGPYWPSIVELAVAASHDPRVVARYRPDPVRLAAIQTPVLILEGSESEPWLRQCATTLTELLPHATQKLLEGQGHFAMYTAPQLLAREISDFLAGI